MTQEVKDKKTIYTKEITDWLVNNTKGLSTKPAWELFQKQFPSVKTTYKTFQLKRKTLGLGVGRVKSWPLYAEVVHGHRLCIKVQSNPAVWVSKQSWIYKEAHPEELNEIRPNDCFVFADGDRNNFSIENIIRIPIKFMGIFSSLGGVVKGNAEATKINAARARLKSAILDRLEDLGEIVYSSKNGRVTKEKARRSAKEYLKRIRESPEKLKIYKEKIKERNKKKWENPTPEQVARRREIARNYSRRRYQNMTAEERKAYNRKNNEYTLKRYSLMAAEELEKVKERKRESNKKYRLKKMGVTK